MIVSISRKGLLAVVAVLALVSLAGGVLYLLGHISVDVGGTAMRDRCRGHVDRRRDAIVWRFVDEQTSRQE